MSLQQVHSKEDTPQEKLSDTNIDDLPHQWKVVKLSDQELFAFENGLWTGKREPFIDCPVIRNTNFRNDGSLNLSDVAIIPIEQRQLEKKRLISGDIIIERSGGGPQQPVGRVVFFDLTQGNYCFSNFTTRLRVIDKAAVDPRYLHLYLLYFHYSGQTVRLQNHTTGIRNLAFEDYKNSLIPLPPYPQQRAIVHALQTAQEAIQTRRDELKLEQERKAALMEYLFTHGTRGEPTKLTEIGEIPASWRVTKLGEVCQFVQYGTSERCEPYASGIPVLRIPNIINGRVDIKDLKYLELPEKVIHSLLLNAGDLLFVRTNGNREYAGRCAVYNDELPKALFASYLIRLRLKSNTLKPSFIQYYTMTHKGKVFLSGRAIATADGKFNINSQTIKSVLLPFPSLQEQDEIVRILDASNIKISTLEQELVLLEELFQALLEELTTGRLSTLPLIEKGETHE